MEHKGDMIVTIRKIQRLRAARSLAKAASEKATKRLAKKRAKERLTQAADELLEVDGLVGAGTWIGFSQLAIGRHDDMAKLLRDADAFFSLAKHEQELASEEFDSKLKQLALAQGLLDLAKRVAGRRAKETKASAQSLSDSLLVEQWICFRYSKNTLVPGCEHEN